VGQKLSAHLRAHDAGATVTYGDLARDNLPHLDDGTLKAISSRDPAEVQDHRDSTQLSDVLIDELPASHPLVIAAPMWNFGIPSWLKAWIDPVVRPGRTFNYAKDSVVGLAIDKKAPGIGFRWRVHKWSLEAEGFRGAVPAYGSRLYRSGERSDRPVEGPNIPPLGGSAMSNVEMEIERMPI
jgi:FMN-dependent NADH-azoreductase